VSAAALPLSWLGGRPDTALARRMARTLDRVALAARLRAVLAVHGAPLGYEVFGQDFVLGGEARPEIAIVIGDAEHDLFFVAQRERGALDAISVHEGAIAAVADFLGRGAEGLPAPRRLAARLVASGPA